jgi:integrase
MASIIEVKGKWRAQVRRKGFPVQTRTFEKKILAEKWARQVEGDIDQNRTGIEVAPKGTTIGGLIKKYREQMGAIKPFGKNKADVLKKLEHYLGNEEVVTFTTERLVRYITEERKVHGVTASIDLTYLGGVFKVARTLWKVPVPTAAIIEAREMLRYMGRLARSDERDRRPSASELERIRGWLRLHSRSLTPDIVDFILASCFRPPSEIVRLRWEDLHEEDRTIVIRDRKDPRKKLGNNMTVPLLGESFDIIMRQPRIGEFIFPLNGHSWSSIFPRCCTELGIEDLQLYDLRHEAISRLVEAGRLTIPQMMLVTGHKDPKQLMRYTQLRARDLHAIANPAPPKPADGTKMKEGKAEKAALKVVKVSKAA